MNGQKNGLQFTDTESKIAVFRNTRFWQCFKLNLDIRCTDDHR